MYLIYWLIIYQTLKWFAVYGDNTKPPSFSEGTFFPESGVVHRTTSKHYLWREEVAFVTGEEAAVNGSLKVGMPTCPSVDKMTHSGYTNSNTENVWLHFTSFKSSTK